MKQTNTPAHLFLMRNNNAFNLAALQAYVAIGVANALQEDAATSDYTAHLIPANAQASAQILCRESATICGLAWADATFRQVAAQNNVDIIVDWCIKEGDAVTPNQTLCKITGNSRTILTAERTALNFLQTLSATATATHQFVIAVSGTKAHILDTRKTIPSLRLAQKYAVTVGGGLNQRLNLEAGMLIKENHIAAAASISAALQAAFALQSNVAANTGVSVPIQIEVENIAQLNEALAAGAKSVLLDNFDVDLLKQAVEINAGRALLEASGGISLENVREIAETGVDRISIGGITKHVQAVDLSLRFQLG